MEVELRVQQHKYTDVAWVENETQEINNDPAVKKKVSRAMRTVAVLKKNLKIMNFSRTKTFSILWCENFFGLEVEQKKNEKLFH